MLTRQKVVAWVLDVAMWVGLVLLFYLAMALHAIAQPMPRPERAEAWIKRSMSYVQVEGVDLARTEQQWQGTLIARIGVGDRFDVVLRADTKPQSQQFTDLSSFELWQSTEILGGGTWAAVQRGNVELALAAVGGVAVDWTGEVKNTPAIGFGGGAVRFGDAYLYVGLGIHQAVNGNRLAVISTLHVPLGMRQLAVDVDLVTGRARRIIVSLSTNVLTWFGSKEG